jgi:tetraacyldisaccharide 4'-kinase
VIDPVRTRAIEYLLKKHDCQFIVCDDGLQHFALKPALSIVVHPRNMKNTYCLPAGPLREPLYRLKNYDLIVDASLVKNELTITDKSGKTFSADAVADEDLIIMTAIARPERFISSLNKLGITGKVKLFPDHYTFEPEDFAAVKKPIIMTEKDWVKFKLLNLDIEVYIACLNIEAEATVLTAIDQLIIEQKRKAV